jgi:DNA-binding LacI/PurR family transcriptional regulator
MAGPRRRPPVTTTKDIAARLNLSVSTVGRALADDHRISAETKFRVNQVAEELGYVGNRAARMMRGARSTVIGLIVPDVGNSFYSTVAHALAETMNSHERQVMLCETGDDRQAELRHVRDLAAAQVAGVVIVPTPKPHAEVARLLKTMPHVQLLRRVPSLGPHWFGIDDHAVIRTATCHLLDLGHERVGYIGGTRDIPTASARLAGLHDAIAAAGLPPESGLVRLGPPSSASFGADAVRALRAAPDAPTAIVTGSVQITRGVLDALHHDGVRVPRQLSVVGFGDEPGFSWWGPGLTTMALPMHDLATACGVWLLYRLDVQADHDAAASPFASVSPGALVLRGSTAGPGGSPATTGRRD